jgi:hypothetical protein
MGAACGAGGGGGAGGNGSGGCGGEDIGVAQEADTCCCAIAPDGTMSCGWSGDCPPYTTNTPDACGSPVTSTGACSTSGVRPGAGSANVGDGLVLLLALAAFRVLARRFASLRRRFA